jgi:membrane protease YdiL (CAAX protease family)
MYHRLARTERYRWWRPLVEILLVGVLSLLLMVAAFIATSLVLGPQSDRAGGMLVVGILSGATIPPCLLAARMMGRPWRTLLAVGERVRWRWLALCLGVAAAKIAVQFAVEATLGTLGHPVAPPRGAWAGWAEFAPLALAVLVAIPPQIVSEELLFRGTLLQALGAWVRAPWFAIGLSSVLFGLAHAVPLAGFVEVTTFGLVAAWLTIRTGGLEAAVALHLAQNASWFLFEAANGRGDRWISDAYANVSWGATLASGGATVLYGAVIAILLARRGRGGASPSREPTQPDDLQLGEGGHHHGLQQDEGHAERAGVDPAGEEQGHAIHGPERIAGDDGPDHAAGHDVAARQQRDEDRVG